MVGIVLATHGDFAKGILQSVTMVAGEQENVAACTLQPSEGPDDIRGKIEEAIASFENQEEVLIMVDLWGGTPFNQSNKLIAGHEDKWAIVAGMNLPMLIDACFSRMTMDTAHEIAAQLCTSGRDGVKVYPETLEPKKEEKAAPAAANVPQGAIPEGTVLGNGKIDLGLVRIDTRLLHGQVATTWTKMVKPDRIIVVSDAVAQDDLRKNMIMQAAPPGVKAHVVPIWKMCEVAKDPRFGDTRALVLFETPQDALKAIKGGVDIKEINLGSMAHSVGKVVCNHAVAMDMEDVKTIEELKGLGVKFNVRKVPTDSPENIDDLLNKAKAELK